MKATYPREQEQALTCEAIETANVRNMDPTLNSG